MASHRGVQWIERDRMAGGCDARFGTAHVGRRATVVIQYRRVARCECQGALVRLARVHEVEGPLFKVACQRHVALGKIRGELDCSCASASALSTLSWSVVNCEA